jgi:hypothetical protein
LTDQNDIYATQEEVLEALAALTADECRLLDYQARRLAFGTIYATGQALFGEAVERAVELRRKWCPLRMSFVTFMRNSMGSIASNDRTSFHAKHITNVSALAAGDDDVDDDAFLSSFGELPRNSVEDMLVQAEEQAAMLRDYDALFEYFSDDEEVWNILDAIERGMVGTAIKEHCKLDDAQYAAARKRLNRGAAKLKSQRTE